MGLMSDIFKRGYLFNGETGLKSGANLEDLVTRAVPVSGTQLVDQVTIEDAEDASITDDTGAAIRRLQVKDSSITRAKLAADGRVPNRADVLAFQVYRNAAQSIAYNTNTLVQLETEVFDYGTCFNVSTYKYTPTVAGIYCITGRVKYANLQGDVAAVAMIYKNGVETIVGSHAITGSTGLHGSQVAGLVEMNGSTDYLQLYTWHSDPLGPLALTVGTVAACVMSGWLIARAA